MTANTSRMWGQAEVTLNALAAVSATDIWGVGIIDDGEQRALIEHWDGRAWTALPDTPWTELLGVTQLSSQDVWAVGDDGVDPLALHWNGTRWQRVPLPTESYNPQIDTNAYLDAVSAVSAHEVWAVGRGHRVPLVPVVEQWDGRRWRRVSTPATRGELDAVVARSSHDVWVGGFTYDPAASTSAPLIAHWDGRRWKTVAIPLGMHDRSSLATGTIAVTGLAVVSAHDIWAVGGHNADCNFVEGCVEGPSAALALHWDGQRWRHIPVPTLGEALTAVTALSSNNVWLASTRALYHWDGRQWRISLRHNGELYSNYSALAVISPTNIWAAGPEFYPVPSDAPLVPRIEHYSSGPCGAVHG